MTITNGRPVTDEDEEANNTEIDSDAEGEDRGSDSRGSDNRGSDDNRGSGDNR